MPRGWAAPEIASMQGWLRETAFVDRLVYN
jgi:hypothetical protein